MRNFGSAALQLSHVAAGRLDGFIELELSIWDAIGGARDRRRGGRIHGAVRAAAADGEGAVPRVYAGARAGRSPT